jgi:hypothetical protein
MAQHWFGSGATLGPVQHWVRPAMGKQAGYGLKGGVLVYFLKKWGILGDEKQGQTKPKKWP